MRAFLLVFIATLFGVLPLSFSEAAPSKWPKYLEYFRSTYRSLDCLRSPNGLINDRGTLPRPRVQGPCHGLSSDQITSPTNIGFDLLSQLAAMDVGFRKQHSLLNLRKIMDGISALERHPTNGLFFSWYQTTKPFTARNRNVSSVDNIHLALALWTLAQRFQNLDVGKTAATIFSTMDFSDFYRPASGLMGGNLQFQPGNRTWFLEGWSYSYYGSEARSIAAVGFALGKFLDPNFIERNTSSYLIEFTPGNFGLRTWDGGVFQLLLPEILMGEDRYSPVLQTAFQNFAHNIVALQKSSPHDAPPTYSASQAGEEGVTCGSLIGCYNGKAGNLSMVASTNADTASAPMFDQWEAVFTPHAAFLVASLAPPEFAPIFQRLSKVKDTHDAQTKLYDPDIGWMDGWRVKAPFTNSVIPVQLALDQEMLLLSLSKILSGDGQTPSSRAIYFNSTTRAQMEAFYAKLETRFSKVLNGDAAPVEKEQGPTDE